MVPFRFRLARVLEWYEERCALERNQLRVRIEELGRIEADINRIRNAVTCAQREMVDRPSVLPVELVALSRYRDRAEQETNRLTENRKQTELAVKKQTELVRTATRQVRLLERLRDRRLSEHGYEVNRELEELASEAFRSSSFREHRDNEQRGY